MSSKKNPPFPRGATLGVTTTTDGTNIEGTIWDFEDVNPATGITRTNTPVRCMAVRNVATIALLPKRGVTLKASGLTRVKQADGHSMLGSQRAFLVDEYLPATTGIPVNDIGWIVIEGPAMATQTVDVLAAIADGDLLVGSTSAASTSNSAGHVTPATMTLATAGAATNPVLNRIGYALSAVASNATYAGTTIGTAADVLVHVTKW